MGFKYLTTDPPKNQSIGKISAMKHTVDTQYVDI